MGFFSDLFSSSDPENAFEECSEALGRVWKEVDDQLHERGGETAAHQFIRHPFILGTVYGFVEHIAQANGVEPGTEDFNGVLGSTLRTLMGAEVAMEIGDKINSLWINASEGDPQFKRGIEKGSTAGMMYAEGLQTGGEVFTVEGVKDRGPKQPMYAKTLLESYLEVLEDDIL